MIGWKWKNVLSLAQAELFSIYISPNRMERIVYLWQSKVDLQNQDFHDIPFFSILLKVQKT